MMSTRVNQLLSLDIVFLRLLDLLLHLQDLHPCRYSCVQDRWGCWGGYGGTWFDVNDKLFLLEVLDGELHGDSTAQQAVANEYRRQKAGTCVRSTDTTSKGRWADAGTDQRTRGG
jgi:hypothetical protein